MIVYSSFEDFLYIIIGLVWIIFSFYKAKKKKQERESPTQTEENDSLVESILNEMGLQDEKEEHPFVEPSHSSIDVEPEIEPEVSSSTYEENSEVFSYDDIYEESNYNSIDDVIERKPVVPIGKIDEAYKISGSSSSNMKITKNFNLSKAIIYSEILKKVYF